MGLSNTLKAALWMLGAVVSFSAMAIAGREISIELDTFEIMMYRSMLGLAIMASIAIITKRTSEIHMHRFDLHIARNICHFAGQNLWFYALTLIPLAHLFAFEFSVPIWVMLVAPFFLSEHLTKIRIISIGIGFAGILMVTRPWSFGLSAGIISAALCAVGFAGSVIFTKKLTQIQSTLSILFWMTALQLIFGILFSGYDLDIAIPTLKTLPGLIVVGLGGLLAHFCITTALQLAPATVATPVDFTRLPIIALIGMLFYNEPLDIWVIVGATIIFASNYTNLWAETRKKRIV